MNFISTSFIYFFILVLALNWLAKRKTIQNVILLVAGYVFIGWVHPWYALLLFSSTLVDYLLALAIERFGDRKNLWLGISLAKNLGALGSFKYISFSPTSMNSTSALTPPTGLDILLPLGISFYTLKMLSYIIDIYRKRQAPVSNFVDFALYISFFPQLLAGPIDRLQKLIPQIEHRRKWTGEFFYAAWPLFVMGLLKKVVVADSIKIVVDKIFALQEPSILLLFTGALGFTLQIFADFSSYTDFSRGMAYLLGFETSKNFDAPYRALTPTDFWSRWHLTFSHWLRDYVFYPSRRFMLKHFKKIPSSITIIIPTLWTMFLSGLWHGSGSTFIVWGIYYGLLFLIYQFAGLKVDWKTKRFYQPIIAWIFMFSLIVFGWSIFRAPSLDWLIQVFAQGSFWGTEEMFIVAMVSLSMTLFFTIPLLLKSLLDALPKYSPGLTSVFYALATILIIVFMIYKF